MKKPKVRSASFGSTRLLALPYVAWLAIFTIAPMILVLIYAFTRYAAGGVLVLTAENIAEAFKPIYMRIFGKSLLFALIATGVCLLLGYPAAYLLSRMKRQTAAFISVLFVLPMWMNFLLRTYAWRNLLDNAGIINQFLKTLGLPTVQFLYTDAAIIFGLVYNFLPFMILPIYTVLQKLDPAYELAAQDLGANRWQTFWKVTVPLTKGGVISGVTMVFMPAMTTFVITRLLGGSHVMLYGDLIEMEFLLMSEWNFGSALAVIMLVLTIVFMWALRRNDKEGEGGRSHMIRFFKRFYLAILLLFMYLPIFSLIVFSFNGSRNMAVWTGFSLHWYEELFRDPAIGEAIWVTVSIALLAASAATLIGTLAAIGIDSWKSKSRNTVINFTYIPLVNADIVTGISLLLLFIFFNIPRGYWTMLLAHITFDIPYVVFSVLPRLRQLDRSTYEAALDMGAKPGYAVRKIILPQILPGVASGYVLAFTMSFDDFMISFFTTQGAIQNLSTYIYSMARVGINPSINALSAIMFTVVICLLLLINVRSVKKARRIPQVENFK